MKANENTMPKKKEPVKRAPETIEERVHRHIRDINSKITDEDIRSVQTELDIRRDASQIENRLPGRKDTPGAQEKTANQSGKSKQPTRRGRRGKNFK